MVRSDVQLTCYRESSLLVFLLSEGGLSRLLNVAYFLRLEEMYCQNPFLLSAQNILTYVLLARIGSLVNSH